MNKFNTPLRNLQRERRHRKSQEKRLRTGLASLKVSRPVNKRPPSGKRLRKIENKQRKLQLSQEAVKNGLVTMKDIEMMSAENNASTDEPAPTKASSGIKLKKLKPKNRRGKSKKPEVEPMQE